MDSSWVSLFQVDRQNTDTATALFSFQSLRSLNLRRKRLKMRFVAQTRKRQGIRRPLKEVKITFRQLGRPSSIFAKAQRNSFFLFAKTLRPGKGLS